MNDYDDSDEYSSANSFRARSNTWPLNRPDYSIPDVVCIDEPLPEIELEEDDLLETNWTIDNDIMSWAPILSSQCQPPVQQQQQQQQPHQQSTTSSINNQHVSHQQHNPTTTVHHQSTTSTPSSSSSASHHTHPHHSHSTQPNSNDSRQQHLQTLEMPQNSSITSQSRQQHQNVHPQQQQQQQQTTLHPQQQHESMLSGSNIMIAPQTTTPTDGGNLVSDNSRQHLHPHHQQQQQHAPQTRYHQHQQQQVALSTQHQQRSPQTLNNAHLVNDQDDPNEFHVQQLHHLRLDNSINGANDSQQQQQQNFAAAMSSMCLQEDSVGELGGTNYDIPSSQEQSHHRLHHHHHHQQHHHHHHHQQEFQHSHLQPLNPARYDLDQRHDFNVEQTLGDDMHLQQQSDQLHDHQHHHHPHPEHSHHHHHHQQQHQQLHLTSSSLDSCSTGHMLSTSLSSGVMCLGGDLEDLDCKPDNPSSLLTNQDFENQPQQQKGRSPSTSAHDIQQDASEVILDSVDGNETKQSNSTCPTKAKLNTPRRNAWGNMSYADLISQAINSTNDKRLTLSQIYDWMVQHVPYFKDKGDSNSSAGWKNSVRHNLSLHNRFKRLQNEGTGKSSWWTINPEASIGKCARRRAASMEASKYEKKRGRAKKRAEAVRQGLISYPSLTDSSLNGSQSTLDPQHTPRQEPQQQPPATRPQQPQQPQQQQQQQQQQTAAQMQQLQTQQSQPQQHQSRQPVLQSSDDSDTYQLQTQQEQVPNQLQMQLQQQSQQSQLSRGLDCEHTTDRPPNENGRFATPQEQQSQYYYQFELSTAL